MTKHLINENLEYGDLKRLVHNELHIDEYKSKMGDDASVCVLSFKMGGKEPAADLVSFVEKGYDWVLDADVSSGEKEGGDYLVFIEAERNSSLPENIVELVNSINNLTEQETENWRVRYYKSSKDLECSVESLAKAIPLSPEAYRKKYEKDEEELDAMKSAAGVTVNTTAPVNEFTESLRIAAGIR